MAEKLRYEQNNGRYEGRKYCITLTVAAAQIGVIPDTLRNWCKFAKDDRFLKPDWFVFPEPRIIKCSDGSKRILFQPEQVEQIKEIMTDEHKKELRSLLVTVKNEYRRQKNVVRLEVKRQKKIEKKKEQKERAKEKSNKMRSQLADKVDELEKKEREATLALLRRRRYRIYIKEQMDKLHVGSILCKDGTALYLYNVQSCIVNNKKGEKILKEKLSDEDFNNIVTYEPVINHIRLAQAIQNKKITAEDVKPFVKRKKPVLKEFRKKEQGMPRRNVVRGEFCLSESIDKDNRRAERAKKTENENDE